MKKLLGILLSAVLVLCWGSFAQAAAQQQEHPEGQQQEHPKEKQEHPKKEEHPKGSQKKMTTDEIDAAIRSSIEQQSQTDGFFHVQDNVLNKSWNLKLDKVHKDKLTAMSADTYFACVDFNADDGTKVDVDFYLKNEDGKLVVTDTSVHKINDVARYMYEQKDGYWVRVENKKAS
ncbi:hypothetical protein L0244_00805 [bacterium]|nr:hypothetical protein [bacterium]MCI0611505.1 hypothetical protein [bacterium]